VLILLKKTSPSDPLFGTSVLVGRIATSDSVRFDLSMPALTRRRSRNEHQETWLIHYGDVRVGRIGIRAGVPSDAEQWGWSCGFYPTGDLAIRRDSGTAPSFKRARRDFAAAWKALLPHLTEADFEAWRAHRDSTNWNMMHDLGLKLPTATAAGVSLCFCGATITNASCDERIHSLTG
jgi:hypothetical protein